jgi:hypothetical protein
MHSISIEGLTCLATLQLSRLMSYISRLTISSDAESPFRGLCRVHDHDVIESKVLESSHRDAIHFTSHGICSNFSASDLALFRIFSTPRLTFILRDASLRACRVAFAFSMTDHRFGISIKPMTS